MGFPSEATTVQNVDIVRAKRVLAIVNELPACRHILLPLVNLLHSPDPKVRSKAASLYGRTSQNGDCVRKRLSDMDPRVRANAVESLWGMDSSSARAVLREASRDQHHRVAANALVGLHRIGAYDVTASLQKMADGAEPMGRAAAAFAMGQILNMDFKPVLESLLKDDSPKVRSQALRSLIRLKRQPEPGEEDLAAGSAAPTGDPVPENATDATPPEPPIDAALPGPAVEAAPPEPANAVPAGTLAPSPEVPPVSADKEDKG
jgi:HEAT repeats/HEAT repeat